MVKQQDDVFLLKWEYFGEFYRALLGSLVTDNFIAEIPSKQIVYRFKTVPQGDKLIIKCQKCRSRN